MRTVENERHINFEDIAVGFIIEMNNYGYVDKEIGKRLAQIFSAIDNKND